MTVLAVAAIAVMYVALGASTLAALDDSDDERTLLVAWLLLVFWPFVCAVLLWRRVQQKAKQP